MRIYIKLVKKISFDKIMKILKKYLNILKNFFFFYKTIQCVRTCVETKEN